MMNRFMFERYRDVGGSMHDEIEIFSVRSTLAKQYAKRGELHAIERLRCWGFYDWISLGILRIESE